MGTETNFADRVRQMVQHETELVNHRMTWFLTSEGVFFAALGVTWDKDLRLTLAIVVVGLVAAISTQVSVQAAIRAVQGLEQCWLDRAKELQVDLASVPPVNGLYQTQIKPYEKLLFPWRLLPWFLAVVWLALGIMALS
jgi:hypothetical protein